MGHCVIRKRLGRSIESHAREAFWVHQRSWFRPLPEHELRSADVAAVITARWEQTDPEDCLQGAPDLVIEVVSPSNTTVELNDKEKLCLENGCREFWVVDPVLHQVRVSKPDGTARTYKADQEIPLDLF